MEGAKGQGIIQFVGKGLRRRWEKKQNNRKNKYFHIYPFSFFKKFYGNENEIKELIV